ncbi:MAG: alpha/beta hydrolase family protein [Actinomycetaceae bacterium]|nr:alpha/beta hydrolase family protein [Actinomycetaceae bacterium]
MARFVCTHVSKALGQETDITIVLPHQDVIEPLSPAEPDWPNHPGWRHSQPQRSKPGVLYLLHGLNGNHSVWNTYSRLDHLADQHNVAIVCPSGYRSFWINQALGMRVRDWVTEELPRFIKRTFDVDTSRERTYIGGMSMGGFGAVYLALQRPDLYGHVFSLSGVLDVNDSIGRKSLPGFYHTSLGGADPKGTEYDLLASVCTYADKCAHHGVTTPDMAILCGTEDSLLNQSQRFCQSARTAGVTVYEDYRPGEHDYKYWTPALYHAMDMLAN